MLQALRKLIPTKSEREVRRLRQVVANINKIYESYHNLTDADLPRKTEEFIARIKDGELLDEILPVSRVL